MKRTKMMMLILGLVSGMGFLHNACAEPVAPRFPDTVLSGERNSYIGGEPLSNQAQVDVSGVLLVSPCILSHWALETQGKGWASQELRQVTLALEGCGDGATQFGMAKTREVALPVSGGWSGAKDRYQLRLHNGENYLSLQVDPVSALLQLEMNYE